MKLGRTCFAAWSSLISAIVVSSVASAQPVSVSYRWTAPRQGGAVDHYNVYHIENDGPAVLTAIEADTTFNLVAQRGVRHRIRVSGVGDDGLEGPLSLASDELYIEIPQTGDEIPDTPLLRPNYPNPFNPETHIVYGIPSGDGTGPDPVLEIYDLRGVRVRRLAVENAPGWHTVMWDGRDETGMVRGSGQYVVRFACAGQVSAWKMTMLK